MAGTIGYLVLGLGPLDAVYQTVITVFSVGFSERGEVTPAYQVFTVAVVLLGNGTALPRPDGVQDTASQFVAQDGSSP